MNTSGEHGSLVSLLIPRQRLLWATVNSDQEWVMWMYNFNKDSYESLLLNQCTKLVQWNNVRWALLYIVFQKLEFFHNQQCSGRVTASICKLNCGEVANGVFLSQRRPSLFCRTHTKSTLMACPASVMPCTFSWMQSFSSIRCCCD